MKGLLPGLSPRMTAIRIVRRPTGYKKTEYQYDDEEPIAEDLRPVVLGPKVVL